MQKLKYFFFFVIPEDITKTLQNSILIFNGTKSIWMWNIKLKIFNLVSDIF